MQASTPRLRAAALAAFLSVFTFAAAVPAAPPTSAATPADVVIAKAKSRIGAPWVSGATGPNSFDCSGFVYWVFRETGYLTKIGGSRMSAAGYLRWFRDRGLTSTTGGRPGDLVVWGGGSHIGIYIGNGYAISTLTSGVKVHGVHAVTASFTAYLRTGLSSGDTAGTTSTSYPIRYTTTSLNWRTGPGTGYAVIKVLASGQKLYVLGSAKDGSGRTWYKVKLSSTSSTAGWVAGWYTRAA